MLLSWLPKSLSFKFVVWASKVELKESLGALTWHLPVLKGLVCHKKEFVEIDTFDILGSVLTDTSSSQAKRGHLCVSVTKENYTDFNSTFCRLFIEHEKTKRCLYFRDIWLEICSNPLRVTKKQTNKKKIKNFNTFPWLPPCLVLSACLRHCFFMPRIPSLGKRLPRKNRRDDDTRRKWAKLIVLNVQFSGRRACDASTNFS